MLLKYPFSVAFQSIWREKWINLLSVLSIGISLFLITVVVLVIYNIDLATRQLPERFTIMVYLKDGIPDEEARHLLSNLRKNDLIEKARYISKDDALKELKAGTRNAAYIFEGLNENPLFSSIEVKLKKQYVEIATIKKLSADIRKAKGVDDVEYGEKFLSAIHSIKTGVHGIGFLLIAITSAGVVFLCYSTVKILFYRKKEEVEILKLLGATKGFIRSPFLIEGGIIGIAGSIATLGGITAFYYGIFYELSLSVPVVKLIVFPMEILFLPVAGLFLGIVGAWVALGRIRF